MCAVAGTERWDTGMLRQRNKSYIESRKKHRERMVKSKQFQVDSTYSWVCVMWILLLCWQRNGFCAMQWYWPVSHFIQKISEESNRISVQITTGRTNNPQPNLLLFIVLVQNRKEMCTSDCDVIVGECYSLCIVNRLLLENYGIWQNGPKMKAETKRPKWDKKERKNRESEIRIRLFETYIFGWVFSFLFSIFF